MSLIPTSDKFLIFNFEKYMGYVNYEILPM